MTSYPIRRAIKASTWYESSPRVLNSQLDGWICQACENQRPDQKFESGRRVRAIIAPHAGYR